MGTTTKAINKVAVFQSLFNDLCRDLFAVLRDDEQLALSLSAEDSFYLRLNQAKVRHAFAVEQGILTIQLISKQRLVTCTIPFCLENSNNRDLALASLNRARDVINQLPIDQFCPDLREITKQVSQETGETTLAANPGWDEEAVCGEFIPLLRGKLQDCAGLLTFGPVIRATATSQGNSQGHNHWFSQNIFNLDLSFYTPNQKAVKFVYASNNWHRETVHQKITSLVPSLEKLDCNVHNLKPGKYRTYLAPQAVAEIISMFSWNGLSARAYHQGESAFKDLAEGRYSLSTKVSLRENFAGLAPRFNSLGELAPLSLSLINQGKLENWLISTRTAKEYNLKTNYANESEGLRAAYLEPGSLPLNDVLASLDTGLYISNLHYLNWSDQLKGRITGMTRYACFWVEGGQIIAPIADIRFDDSLFSLLGKELIDLTNQVETIPETSTYDQRSVGGIRTPGILINAMNYTL